MRKHLAVSGMAAALVAASGTASQPSEPGPQGAQESVRLGDLPPDLFRGAYGRLLQERAIPQLLKAPPDEITPAGAAAKGEIEELRVRFACAAMQGLLANPSDGLTERTRGFRRVRMEDDPKSKTHHQDEETAVRTLGEDAFVVADVMVAMELANRRVNFEEWFPPAKSPVAEPSLGR